MRRAVAAAARRARRSALRPKKRPGFCAGSDTRSRRPAQADEAKGGKKEKKAKKGKGGRGDEGSDEVRAALRPAAGRCVCLRVTAG